MDDDRWLFRRRAFDRGRLPPRQRQVLLAWVRGLTEQGIALEMGVSVNTIKRHKESLRDRYSASTMQEVLVEALQAGAVSLRDCLVAGRAGRVEREGDDGYRRGGVAAV